jgi:hypothetical protein
MFFSMNHRKRAPMGIIQVAQVVDNPRSTPLQVASVPVVKAVANPNPVESCITKPIKKDERYEVRENIRNSEKKIIIYTIGEEEENHEEDKEHEEHEEHENIPVPFLEEPVIETLSSVVVPVCSLPPIIEEESKDDDVNDHQDSIEQVQQLHEVKKKKRRMKGVRK